MFRRSLTLALSLWLFVATTPLVPAQTRKRPVRVTSGPILEKNIRAELSFLASDALQGRGSGTGYECIAAEYIGSQFRQFGLEPGGDADSAGNKTFVQRVPLNSGINPASEPRATWNAIGVLKGSQPGEAIMLSAHLDHL